MHSVLPWWRWPPAAAGRAGRRRRPAAARSGPRSRCSGGSKDSGRQGPAAPVEGATPGGTITVHLPGAPGPDSLDPTAGWSVVGNAIQQALVSRSLTQYARDADGNPVLVPDLATDLGSHNEDFTEWTFTIRDDATWQDGSPVTPEEVAFGICRSLDAEAFPAGPGTQYSRTYFAGASDYDGPYTGDDPGCDDYDAITVDGQDVTIEMAAAVPRHGLLGRRDGDGPGPAGRRLRARHLRPGADGQRPLPGRELVARPRSWCWCATRSGTPAPTRRGTSTPTAGSSSSTRTRPWSTR